MYFIFVSTRSFGVTDVYTSLVPLADHLNHEANLTIFTTSENEDYPEPPSVYLEEEFDEEIEYKETFVEGID